MGGGKDDGAEAWWLCWGTMWVGCPAEELGVCASGTSPLACKAPFRLPRAALSFIYAPPPPALCCPPSPRAVTPDFGGLLKREMALEGQFRNAHVRLRTHAESGGWVGGGGS